MVEVSRVPINLEVVRVLGSREGEWTWLYGSDASWPAYWRITGD